MGFPLGAIVRTHSHLCPVCKQAFNCKGERCAPYNGVPHRACAPQNRAAKWTVEVKPKSK